MYVEVCDLALQSLRISMNGWKFLQSGLFLSMMGAALVFQGRWNAGVHGRVLSALYIEPTGLADVFYSIEVLPMRQYRSEFIFECRPRSDDEHNSGCGRL